MKLFIFIIAALFSSNSFCIGLYATLKGDQKIVTDRIKDELQISEDDAYAIYQKYLDYYVGPKSEKWNYYSSSNKTLTASKVAGSRNRMLTFDLVNGDRIYNIMFVKYADEKQVLIHTLETLPRTADTVIKRQSELKKDAKYKFTTEDSSYTAIEHKENSLKVFLLADSGIGVIQYVEDSSYELSKPLMPPSK